MELKGIINFLILLTNVFKKATEYPPKLANERPDTSETEQSWLSYVLFKYSGPDTGSNQTEGKTEYVLWCTFKNESSSNGSKLDKGFPGVVVVCKKSTFQTLG